MTAFKFDITLRQKLIGIRAAHLSLASYNPIHKKNLTSKEHTCVGRLSPQEHLNDIVERKILVAPQMPLMILSARNVLANLRCIGYVNNRCRTPIGVAEEELITKRPYEILALSTDGRRFMIGEYLPGQQQEDSFQWFISGIPVLWDNEDPNQLIRRLVPETADHSHVWHLPRGNHPSATPETLKHWNNLQDIFKDTLHEERETAFMALNNYAVQHKLIREDHYLHNIIGVDAAGSTLYQLIGRGRLEHLGSIICQMGATRAICVDNSGSTVVRFYPDGAKRPSIQLYAAPNHRPPGTAFLVIELLDNHFE